MPQPERILPEKQLLYTMTHTPKSSTTYKQSAMKGDTYGTGDRAPATLYGSPTFTQMYSLPPGYIQVERNQYCTWTQTVSVFALGFFIGMLLQIMYRLRAGGYHYAGIM